MRIFGIYPGLNFQFDDVAQVLLELRKRGNQICVLAGRSLGLKGEGYAPRFEVYNGIEVHRIFKNFNEQASYPVKKNKRIYAIVRKFEPDIIFCCHQKNMWIARMIKNLYKLPIILSVEYAYNPFELLGKKERWWLKKGPVQLLANLYWRWLCTNADAIITANPQEKKQLVYISRFGTPVYHVPWCHHIPADINECNKRKPRGIYVGSLIKRKNVEEFKQTIPLILNNTATKEFYIIGPERDVNVVESLKKQLDLKIYYKKFVQRKEALNLIATSFFAYSPVISGGWGFIGDCWGVGVPVVTTHQTEYDLKNGMDALIAYPSEIHRAVNKLYRNKNLYAKLVSNGKERHTAHTAKVIADKYERVFNSVR